jgi:hypothetical protein
MVYNNSANINPTGLVKADGSGGFSGETTTQYNVLSGAASNGINNISPGTAGYVLTSNGPSAQPTFQIASGGSITINGDSGSATGTTIDIITDVAAIGAGSTVLFDASGSTSTLKVSDANSNTLIGDNAGNATLSGNYNTSLGVNTLQSLTTGYKNTVVGWNSGSAITDGLYNVLLGDNCGPAIQSGQFNVFIGHEVAPSFVGSGGFPNGCFNILMGVSAGYYYTSTEQNNIIIGSSTFGVAGENNVMRLGSSGPYQNTVDTYVAGITGHTVAASSPVGVNSSGQLSDLGFGSVGEAFISGGAGVSPSFGVLGPAGGGTGSSTTFTQGSVVFAGASGIYSQDNANFFWDDTNNRLGVVTNTPVSSFDVKGNVSIGTYGGTNAAPTNGLIVSGQTAIGTNAPGPYNMLQINPTLAHGASIAGTMTAVDASNNQHAWNTQQTFAPTSGATICSSFEGTPKLAVPVGQTVTSAVTFRSSPDFSGNAGTITTKYGFWFDGGGAGSGTITTAYGAYFATPVAGTTKIALYADSAAIGTSGTAPPANGLLVNGAIKNTNLTAKAALYVDASQQLASTALTDGQLLIGSTGNIPAAATLSAGTGISITNAAGSITIASTSVGVVWTEVTGTSQSMAVNSAYIANNAGLVTLTLPSTAALGSIVWVVGKGAGLWKIAQNAGQTIHFGSNDTTTGVTGSLTATNRYDAIQLLCTTANTDWTCTGIAQGNITVA